MSPSGVHRQRLWRKTERVMRMKEQFEEKKDGTTLEETLKENPEVLEEIEIEDLTVDGICGVY